MPTISAPLPDGHLLLGWEEAPSPPAVGFAAELTDPPPQLDQEAEPCFADPEGHLLTIGPTGSGKGRAALIPALLTYDGAAVVIDPKGEAYRTTARRRATLGPVVRLDPFGVVTDRPDALNPFDMVTRAGLSPTEAALVLADLLAPKTFAKDPFWDNRARALIAGLTAYVLACRDPIEHHPETLRAILMEDDVAYAIAVLLDTAGKTMPRFAYQELAQFLQLPERETRPSVLATATQHTTLLGDETVADALRVTSFDLDALRDGTPMTIYLILPVERLGSHGLLLRLWVATLLRILLTRTRQPATPTLFLLDEAAQLGTLPDLVTAVTLLRGYGVRVWSFWQDLAQVKTYYPKAWPTLLSNARTLQLFEPHWLFRRELATLLHVLPDDLTLPPDQQLLVGPDGVPRRARKADYLTDALFAGHFDVNPLAPPPRQR
ncbi:MAG: type IV secretory system conjugative DNA transfer family protein [Pseudomonadota bacterium]